MKNNSQNKIYDVIIIGAGPGGLTSALYTSRANLKTLILDKGLPGGQLNNTEEVENFPGFIRISGAELAQRMYEHTLQFGAQYEYGDVKNITPLNNNTFKVNTGNKSYLTKTVIIATGTKYKKLNIPGEEKFTGRGVSWCAVCDGAFYKDKHVVVVGGGDSAVEEAMYLTKFASKVTIVHRRDKFRAQPILVNRMLQNKKIEVIYNAQVVEILGNNKVESVVIKYNNISEEDKSKEIIACDGVFEYIGMIPVTDFVQSLGITNEEGWIITDQKMKTKIPGIFAIGDVRADSVRQIVAATGDGCIAAIEVQHYIENL